MDDDYDDGSYFERPRLQLATGDFPSTDDDKPQQPPLFVAAGFVGSAVALLAGAFFCPDVIQFFIVWLALALAIGPFAPNSVTGGVCSVGDGDEMPDFDPYPEEEQEEVQASSAKRGKDKRAAAKSSVASVTMADLPAAGANQGSGRGEEGGTAAAEEVGGSNGEWSRAEWDQLRKAMMKFPRGTPQRWETIAKHLGGKRAVEDVVQVAKAMAEKKPSDKDAYASFLAQRKNASRPIGSEPSQRWEASADGQDASGKDAVGGKEVGGGGEKPWSEAEDRALVQALKEFPKQTSMRWDRVSSAMPGRSKQQCFKRFSELREMFKTTRGGGDDGIVDGESVLSERE